MISVFGSDSPRARCQNRKERQQRLTNSKAALPEVRADTSSTAAGFESPEQRSRQIDNRECLAALQIRDVEKISRRLARELLSHISPRGSPPVAGFRTTYPLRNRDKARSAIHECLTPERKFHQLFVRPSHPPGNLPQTSHLNKTWCLSTVNCKLPRDSRLPDAHLPPR